MLAPLATIVAFYAEKERKKALAGSDVKIKATDVMASVKVVSSLVLYPFYYFFLASLSDLRSFIGRSSQPPHPDPGPTVE